MAPETCGRCGRPASGFATINDVRYCHGEDAHPTCYEEAQAMDGVEGRVLGFVYDGQSDRWVALTPATLRKQLLGID